MSTLITDPDVIADQGRYVKLTKEYKDLSDIMDARKRFRRLHQRYQRGQGYHRQRERSRHERRWRARNSPRTRSCAPNWREEIKTPARAEGSRGCEECRWRSVRERVATRLASFAGDLFAMYKKRYCDSMGWQLSVTDASEGAVGRLKRSTLPSAAERLWRIEV